MLSWADTPSIHFVIEEGSFIEGIVDDFALQVGEDCTADELKKMVQAKTRIPTQDQLFSQDGERIELHEGICDLDLSLDVELGECQGLRPLSFDLSQLSVPFRSSSRGSPAKR
jgi:hypothetical protein